MAELIITDVNGKESIFNSKSEKCISDSEFSNRNDIQKIIIPEGIVIIDDDAFEYCQSLEEITLPQSLLEIATGAFKGCSKLKKITLPTYLRHIGLKAFKSTGLKIVSVRTCEAKNEPEVDEFCYPKISHDAFTDCIDLTEVTIPDNIIWIEDNAFHNCPKLKKVTFPPSLYSIGSFCFSGCALKEVTFPETLIRINIGAFSDNQSLEEIILPRSLKKIGDSAFARSGLKKVSFSASTDKAITDKELLISKSAFNDCKFLEEFTFPKEDKKPDFFILQNCPNLKHIFIE